MTARHAPATCISRRYETGCPEALHRVPCSRSCGSTDSATCDCGRDHGGFAVLASLAPVLTVLQFKSILEFWFALALMGRAPAPSHRVPPARWATLCVPNGTDPLIAHMSGLIRSQVHPCASAGAVKQVRCRLPQKYCYLSGRSRSEAKALGASCCPSAPCKVWDEPGAALETRNPYT